MENNEPENYEMELNVPTPEKLEAMVNLFEFAMNESEQKMFLLYMLAQAIETFGPNDLKARVELMIADGIGDCPDNCPLCNPEKEMMTEEQMQRLWEMIKENGTPAGSDTDEDWDEVIH